MPYIITQKDGKHCVYKQGDDKQPTGESLGCHSTAKEAEAQQRALYANEAKSAIDAMAVQETKAGARHSANDQGLIQGIHDAAVQAGAMCPDMAHEASPHDPMEDMGDGFTMKNRLQTGGRDGTDVDLTRELLPPTPDDTLVAFGGSIKALGKTADGGLHIGGYLVRFGGPDKTDISGERDYFTKDTDFGDAKSSDVYYNHRLPITGKDGEEIVVRRRFGKGALSMDDVGVFIDAVTFNRDAYEQVLNEGIKATPGKHGWSSGTAAHLVDREPQSNGSNWVKKWPLGLDASLTPTPAEPQTRVVHLKSLAIGQQPGWAAPDGATAAQIPINPLPHKETSMPTELEQIMAAVGDLTKSVGALTADLGSVKAKLNEPQLPPVAAPNIPDAAKGVPVTGVRDLEAEKKFTCVGEQFAAIKHAAFNPGATDKRLLHINDMAVKATGASESGTEGFLIQPDFVNEMQQRMYNTGEILSRVSRRQIGEGKNGLVVNRIDETSRVDGSRGGGVLAYWMNEAATKTKSKPTYSRFELYLEKLAGLYYATDEVLQDVSALSGEVDSGFTMELQFAAERAIYEGSGAGKPMGLTRAPALIDVPKETNQAATTIVWKNLSKMWNRLWSPLRKGAIWLAHQDTEPELQALALPVGTAALEPRFVNYAPDGTLTIFGRPVIIVEYASTLGTTGDIMLTNLSEYRWIEKGGIKSDSSIHVQFVTDETAFRWVWRCNGKPFWNAALTPLKGTTTLSHVVTLATRA